MIGTVVKTFLYPIKGVHGIETTNRGLQVSPEVGVVGDRNLAVYRKSKNVPDSWKPKGMFYVCMNREDMATETSLTEADLDPYYRLAPDVAEGVLTNRGLLSGQERLVDTEGTWHLSDNNQPFVSFLNLASVRELERTFGTEIDPRRFRMNVWLEGLEPWAELDFTGLIKAGHSPRLCAGSTSMIIDSLCGRCKAIEQSPQSGKWDINLQQLLIAYLEDHAYPHQVMSRTQALMGWYAVPTRSGKVYVGDKVSLPL